MKKVLFIAVILLMAGIAAAQSLQKGNLVGIHIVTSQLKPGITENQAVKFILEKMIPAWENAYGIEVFLMRGVRGELAGKLAMMAVFKDEGARDIFFADNSDAAKANDQVKVSLKELTAEADKLWVNKFDQTIYCDYVVKVSKGEPIQKGNLIGIHNQVLKLAGDATESQYFEYWAKEVEPTYEKYDPGVKVSVCKCIRGAEEGKIAGLYIFVDESARNKYFDKDDKVTQFKLDFDKKVQPISEGLAKIGTVEGLYTDWLVL